MCSGKGWQCRSVWRSSFTARRPAGPSHSTPAPAAAPSAVADRRWQELVADNPVLAGLEPDVEALLVQLLAAVDHYLVSIDECFKLIGLIRMHWRGLSGGQEAWEAIGGFFKSLNDRTGGTSGAMLSRPLRNLPDSQDPARRESMVEPAPQSNHAFAAGPASEDRPVGEGPRKHGTPEHTTLIMLGTVSRGETGDA